MQAFQAFPQSGPRLARMEQRTSPEVKALIEEAAALLGITASEFIVSHAAQAAREALGRAEGTRLMTEEDRRAFLLALEDTEPNAGLIDLMSLRAEVARR